MNKNGFVKRFQKALIENGVNQESFKQFRKFSPEELEKAKIEIPQHTNQCICLHHITQNCYAVDPVSKKVLVLGNCCIQKTMTTEQRGKHCEKCDKPHRKIQIIKVEK